MFAGRARFKALRAPVICDTPMLSLARDGDAHLEWRQPRWDQYLYRLESSRGLLAVLQTVGFFQLATTLQTAEGTSRVKSRWTGDSELHFEDESEPRIKFRPDWWFGGRLELLSGEVLPIKRQGLRAHQLESGEGFELATFAGSREWFKSGSELTVSDAMWRRDDALELLGMGFAMVAMLHRRSSG